MLDGGQLKVFENMDDWWGEYRIYRRDKNGKVIKKKDHLMDATRYLCVSGIQLMTVEPTRFTKSLNSTAVDADVGY